MFSFVGLFSQKGRSNRLFRTGFSLAVEENYCLRLILSLTSLLALFLLQTGQSLSISQSQAHSEQT